MTKGKGNLAIPLVIALDERLAGGRTMTDCYLVGIAGDCSFTCPVLQDGQCEHEAEMIERRIEQEADDRYHALKDDGRIR
jgi:hypothetical protein